MSQEPIAMQVTAVRYYRDDLANFRMVPEHPHDLAQLEWLPGQIAILAVGKATNGYFAIASPPEERAAVEFLVKRGMGVSEELFNRGVGASVAMVAPVGKGFPINNYRRRDLLLMGVGTAVAPLRSVIKSVLHRRSEFGRIVLIYGVRFPHHFAYEDEIEMWRARGIEVVLTVSQPEDFTWSGATGYVQDQLTEAASHLTQPVALICGMREMMQDTTTYLSRQFPGLEILTNF